MSSGVNIQKTFIWLGSWEKEKERERDSKITGDVLGKHPVCPVRPIRDESHCIHPGRTHKEGDRKTKKDREKTSYGHLKYQNSVSPAE